MEGEVSLEIKTEFCLQVMESLSESASGLRLSPRLYIRV